MKTSSYPFAQLPVYMCLWGVDRLPLVRCLAGLVLLLAATLPVTAQSADTAVVESSPAIANCSIIPVPPPAATNVIRITPDRADWTYPLGATPVFKVNLAVSPYPDEGIPITYRLGPEQLEGAEQTAVVPADGLIIPAGTRNEPGFTRLLVSAIVDGQIHKDLCTVAVSPDRILPTQTEPPDFDAFWEKQKASMANLPLAPELEPMPELSTPTVEVFHWSIQNVGNWAGPSRLYGILAVPRGAGPFPAVLYVPGAGVRPYWGQIDLAARGVITLEIGIHGMPVNLDTNVYHQLSRGGLSNYQSIKLDDRESFFYRRVYLGCLRANDYLASHPKWDGTNLLVVGSSQGGMLAIVTAALDPRVTALLVGYPAFCDVTGYLHGRAGGWPGFFHPGSEGKLQVLASDEPRRLTTMYYDTVNFARRLKAPGHYSFGYNDTVCPPTSMFAAYNSVTAPKELVLAPEQGHRFSDPQHQHRGVWFDARLGLK